MQPSLCCFTFYRNNNKFIYFLWSNTMHNFRTPRLSNTTITSTSQVCESVMPLQPIVKNDKVWGRGGLQWHKVRTTFWEHWSNASEVEREYTKAAWWSEPFLSLRNESRLMSSPSYLCMSVSLFAFWIR